MSSAASSSPCVRIHLVAGARPNFVKIAALWHAFQGYLKVHPQSPLRLCLINTGQHYDYLMSQKLFEDFELPAPAIDLEVGSSSHAHQTAKIMMRYEKVLLRDKPHLVIVVGDVNSTMACSLVAVKFGIPVAHIEAGLRSWDRSMPEEINRIVTDAIADLLFTTSLDANKNLRREGVPLNKIHFVGNVMVDTLKANLPKAPRSLLRQKLGLRSSYAVLTLHRPSNVDRDQDFLEILNALEVIQKEITIIFPAHPRTANKLKGGSLHQRVKSMTRLKIIPPLGYLDFMGLLKNAKLVLTDSGGIQEETTVLGIPCLTLRDNTERPITLTSGTNHLTGCKSQRIIRLALKTLKGQGKKIRRIPPLWDGHAADRIVRILARKFKF